MVIIHVVRERQANLCWCDPEVRLRLCDDQRLTVYVLWLVLSSVLATTTLPLFASIDASTAEWPGVRDAAAPLLCILVFFCLCIPASCLAYVLCHQDSLDVRFCSVCSTCSGLAGGLVLCIGAILAFSAKAQT